jgi:hypothetical protein
VKILSTHVNICVIAAKKLYNIRTYLHWGHENFTYFLQHRSTATVIVAGIFTRIHLSRFSIGNISKAKMPTIARRGSHYCSVLATLGGATQIGSFILATASTILAIACCCC